MSEEVVTSGIDNFEEHRFTFTGKTKEYFGIWIVNLLLSIVTLGIYTAWAKVRRLRYFYANTWLDGHNFEYHAKPVQILIGRIIVILFFILINVVAEFYPLAALAFLLPYLLLLPWLINKALQFNARVTSYRNIRFGFTGSYLKALWVFGILPLIIPALFFPLIFLTVYLGGATLDQSSLLIVSLLSLLFVIGNLLIYPYISKKINEYIANGLSFGTAKFEAKLPLKKLYGNLGFMIVTLLSGLLVICGILYVVISIIGAGIDAAEVKNALSVIMAFIIYTSLLVAYLAYSAGVRNIAYNATKLAGEHQLRSTLPRYGYAWVMLSNLVISIITIGLAIPWAAVRKWRYLAKFTAVTTFANFDNFTADQSEQGNVAASEYLDIDGIDFGL